MATIHIHLPARKKAADRKVRDADTGTLKQPVGKHAAGEKFKILSFKGSGQYRVQFENGDTETIGQSAFARDAGFDRREYSPREWNRLQSEIKELEAKIKVTKAPYQKQDLERTLAKVKAEQAKYRTDDSDPSLELAYAVERDPKAVGTKAKKKFKSESEFLAALLKGGMSRSEGCVQEALKAYRVADAGGVESLSADDVAEKYGFTFLSRVQRQKEATAPDGKVVRADGNRFTVTA